MASTVPYGGTNKQIKISTEQKKGHTLSSWPNAPQSVHLVAGLGHLSHRCPGMEQLAHTARVAAFAASSGSTKYLDGVAPPPLAQAFLFLFLKSKSENQNGISPRFCRDGTLWK